MQQNNSTELLSISFPYIYHQNGPQKIKKCGFLRVVYKHLLFVGQIRLLLVPILSFRMIGASTLALWVTSGWCRDTCLGASERRPWGPGSSLHSHPPPHPALPFPPPSQSVSHFDRLPQVSPTSGYADRAQLINEWRNELTDELITTQAANQLIDKLIEQLINFPQHSL